MYFVFNNISSDELGLLIEHRPNIPNPKSSIEYINIPGREGTLTVNNGGYDDITIKLDLAFLDINTYMQKSRVIKNWLKNSGKLMFSYDDEVYYKVKNVEFDQIGRVFKNGARFSVQFICEPFSYLSEGDNAICLTNSSTLYNPGIYSKPVLKIYGTGNVSITINDSIFYINNLVDYVVVDSEIMDCYKETELKNDLMIGDFPILSEKENIINWTGNISKIELIPNFRCI